MGFTHFNEQGRAKMVDVSEKATSKRTACARARLAMKPQTLEAIRLGHIGKGDVLAVAQVAGIMAAKKTSDWIPMCHPLPLTSVDIQFQLLEEQLVLEATVSTKAPTGVEMEALTAVSAAALTVYDMCKSIQKDICILETRLIFKTGGKSGDYHFE